MKKIFLVLPFLFLVMMTPAHSQLSSDATGLVNRLDVESGGHTYEVEVVSNFDITDFDFNKDEEKLTLHLASNLENNLGEMIIPQNLLGGNFTFYLDDQEIFPLMRSSEKISFITLNFTGAGNHTLDIFAIDNFDDLPATDDQGQNESPPPVSPKSEGGCLIATATFGSELSPQVQILRELRDNSLLQTKSGTDFMNSFNSFYYSFSPAIADYERENPMFREAVKLSITPMLFSLSLLNHVDMDTESKALGYGISLILLNIGMYFVAPIIVLSKIHKIKKSKLN
ncbi:MAG: CFI-box-CTERM domain-containing protein [Nitrosopumilus sp.]